VLHLDDLLLRRTRLGLLLAHGGRTELPQIRALCQPRLAWSDVRWQQEERDYLALWQRSYSLPASAQQGSLP
jgi:glycerol-3-phosphate dehydrogenase